MTDWQMARLIAIYGRLRGRFPAFQVTVSAFECGGGEEGTIPTTGYQLYWEMLPTPKRGYVRGTARLARYDRLVAALHEAWQVCRRWGAKPIVLAEKKPRSPNLEEPIEDNVFEELTMEDIHAWHRIP